MHQSPPCKNYYSLRFHGRNDADEVTAFINSLRNKVLAFKCRAFAASEIFGSPRLPPAAAGCGVQQFKVSCGGNSGHLSMEQFLNALKVRGEALGITCGANVTALFRTCRQIDAITGSSRSDRFALATEEGGSADQEELRADADISAVRKHIELLGYDVSNDDLNEIYRVFKEIARSKKVVSRDLEAIVAETAGQVTPTYHLDNYVINSGNAIVATAFIRLLKTAPAPGDFHRRRTDRRGFQAIEQILGRHFELDEFQIQAVTKVMRPWATLVKLRYNGKLYSGRGLSTDIVGASIRSYLSAVNKIVNEEKSL